ncbi:MAG: hypothetical protein ABL963_02675 [Longimicrobiales bacterium]
MRTFRFVATLCGVVSLALPFHRASGQSTMQMPTLGLGGGWRLTGMAQAYPIVTVGAPGDDGSPLRETGWYLTQPALMGHVESPGQRVVLHSTLNFEGLTQPDGELTFGGWGEGFLDKRHPHTLVHELMLSMNFWQLAGGSASISAGKGFAPYGTSDPMARPGLKYPTNHHLSQILERWTLNAAWMRGGWSVEAGIFGGQEPEGAYDFSNIESFGDSWSARVARRWGTSATGPLWEGSVSLGRITQFAHTRQETTRLTNAALMRSGPWVGGQLYTLAEASQSYVAGHQEFFSLLGEARWSGGGHQPYVRVEYASRPEYAREGAAGDEGYFRYEHEQDPIGATRWLIATAAYAFEMTPTPWSVRPFLEVQRHHVRGDGGGISASGLFGSSSFWALSFGARVFVGGEPMRMGSYGILDGVTQVVTAGGGALHVH